MANNIVYIADSKIQQELKKDNLNQVSLSSETQVKSQPDIQVANEQVEHTGLLITVLIIVFILVAVLIGIYLNLKNQPDIQLSGLLSSSNNKKKDSSDSSETNDIDVSSKIDEIFSEDDKQENINQTEENTEITQNEPEIQNFMSEEDIIDDSNNDTSLKLSTPRSIEKCIKSFLEITKEN